MVHGWEAAGGTTVTLAVNSGCQLPSMKGGLADSDAPSTLIMRAALTERPLGRLRCAVNFHLEGSSDRVTS